MWNKINMNKYIITFTPLKYFRNNVKRNVICVCMYSSHIDANKTKYISTLKEAVAIPSVSAWPDNRKDVVKMVEWTAERLKALGASVEFCDVGTQELPDGRTIPLPPVIIGSFGKDAAKKTVCVYGHLDVQPALKVCAV